jgi:hypothetical protein
MTSAMSVTSAEEEVNGWGRRPSTLVTRSMTEPARTTQANGVTSSIARPSVKAKKSRDRSRSDEGRKAIGCAFSSMAVSSHD